MAEVYLKLHQNQFKINNPRKDLEHPIFGVICQYIFFLIFSAPFATQNFLLL